MELTTKLSMLFRRFSILVILFSNLQVVVIESETLQWGYFGFGERHVALVAFSKEYTLAHFIETITNFANAINCGFRQQYTSIYFGDLSMRIDCYYDLVECVNDRLLTNASFMSIVHQVIRCLIFPNPLYLPHSAHEWKFRFITRIFSGFVIRFSSEWHIISKRTKYYDNIYSSVSRSCRRTQTQ